MSKIPFGRLGYIFGQCAKLKDDQWKKIRQHEANMDVALAGTLKLLAEHLPSYKQDLLTCAHYYEERKGLQNAPLPLQGKPMAALAVIDAEKRLADAAKNDATLKKGIDNALSDLQKMETKFTLAHPVIAWKESMLSRGANHPWLRAAENNATVPPPSFYREEHMNYLHGQLISAVRKNDVQNALVLIEVVYINERDTLSRLTPLMEAAAAGCDIQVVEALLRKGADAHATCGRGVLLPGLPAFRKANASTLTALRGMNADTATALDLANAFGNTAIAQVIQRTQAQPARPIQPLQKRSSPYPREIEGVRHSLLPRRTGECPCRAQGRSGP